MACTVGLTDGALWPTTSSRPRTSWWPTARRSARSGGRSRAATRRRPSPPRSPGWPRPARSPTPTATTRRARVYRATADHYQRRIKGWTVTTTGPLSDRPLLHPAVQDRRPQRGDHLQPRQRRPRRRPAGRHRRRVPRADPARHPARRRPRRRSVAARRGRHHRPGHHSGQGFYRYGTVHRRAPRTGTATATCPTRPTARPPASRGRPAAATAPGTSGRCCPASGRSTQLQTGDRGDGVALLLGMAATASGIGLVPEQAWENPDLAASPFGTDPRARRSGSRTAGAAGRASPLTWAQAQ